MIRVYVMDVTPIAGDADLFKRIYGTVPPSRREKADRMRRHSDKCLSLGAGTLLDLALKREDIETYDIDTATPNGKPRLLVGGAPGPEFNLSHSGVFAMCALSDAPVGCDVEIIKTREREDGIYRRFFAEDEKRVLDAEKNPDERQRLFFRYWTLKESFLKATGFGLSLELNAFTILLPDGQGGDPRVRYKGDDRAYFFREFAPADGYCFSLCSMAALPEKLEVEMVKAGMLP